MFLQSRRNDKTISRLTWQIENLKLAIVNLVPCRAVVKTEQKRRVHLN